MSGFSLFFGVFDYFLFLLKKLLRLALGLVCISVVLLLGEVYKLFLSVPI